MDNLQTLPIRSGFFTRLLSRITHIQDLSIIPRLLVRAHRYDLIIISGGERGELLYYALAGLLPWIRTPHLIIDAHWQPASGLVFWLQRAILRAGRRLNLQVQPHSAEEIALYRDNFGIPEHQIGVVPWSTSLIGYRLNIHRGDFILTGGWSCRDYAIFFQAVSALPYRVKVGLPFDWHAPSENIAEAQANIEIHHDWSNREFMDQMAACRVLALPITPNLKRSTGDRTILNAMYMHKIVVATDSIGSRIYIRHGINGFLVPEGDVQAWKDIIERIYNLSEDEYQNIACEAEFTAKAEFNEELRLIRTLESAFDALQHRPSPTSDRP
jgi:glycosyltransferase involved in cell wall biosynthesis